MLQPLLQRKETYLDKVLISTLHASFQIILLTKTKINYNYLQAEKNLLIFPLKGYINQGVQV